jgi:hypothetical protein
MNPVSRGTSPVDSNTRDTNVVYEVLDSGAESDDVVEKPAEDAEAELSMQSPCMRLCYLPLIRSDWQRLDLTDLHVFQSCTVLNISTDAKSMSSSVQPPTARGGTAMMCTDSWTLAMRNPQVVFTGMPKCVGVMKRLQLLTE